MTLENCPKVLINRKEIDVVVQRLAEEITRDYEDKYPLIIIMLKGSFIFAADLIRRLDFPLEIEFLRLSSYGEKQESSGNVNLVQGLHVPIKDRHVLILEDIIDTGHTISFLMKYLGEMQSASLKLCALTDKPSRRQVPVTIDYLGFTVPNKFIVGYGIDWDEKYRYLPDICVIE
jgi:hypoxanthine phosphoribosyltransferase